MVVAEVSIVPIGTGTPSVSSYVAGVLEVLKQEKDVTYQLTAMGTIIQGDLNRVLSAIAKMHESVFSDEIKRVLTSIRIDERRDKNLSIAGKVGAVKRKIKGAQ